MPNFHRNGPWRAGMRSGAVRGWRSFLWTIKLIVPLSLFTAVLAWSGLIERIDFALQPLMGFLHLPAMAALPLLLGLPTGIYGGIAAMVVLPLDEAQMTVIAVFLLTAHSLIQEGIIQDRSGLPLLRATAVRLVAAVATVLVIAPWIGSTPDLAGGPSATVPSVTFAQMLLAWVETTSLLCLKIFVIIMTLLMLLDVLREMGWVEPLVGVLSPLLWLMGLNRKMGFLWLTAVLFGLTYGGAMIVEEARTGSLRRDDLELLQMSVGIHHSVVEDPALLLSLGLSAFWLYVPRLAVAIATVRFLRFWQGMRRPRPEA
ncbi:MAG: hypothetical protein A4E73_04061 [Syntrophaceae bacterium PtaU1.Bin231]|mgnify:CR=1 FL=1|nr:MAG: hypothetical protein A4E73_04061 [Syntrophaceae bacterium PtaU1.Bin231]HOG15856.1 hypothetical protein [Syntrophales bacterium]